jgi:hypothetical protein
MSHVRAIWDSVARAQKEIKKAQAAILSSAERQQESEEGDEANRSGGVPIPEQDRPIR